MVSTILGRKIGMTQVWDENDNVVPVTVILAGPCTVSQVKTKETDGYDASTDQPAAIDNISLERIVCPQPQQLTATATEDEMLLSWHRAR